MGRSAALSVHAEPPRPIGELHRQDRFAGSHLEHVKRQSLIKDTSDGMVMGEFNRPSQHLNSKG